VLVNGKPFQPSLLFAGRDGRSMTIKWGTKRYSTQGGSCLKQQCLITLKKEFSKHSSLSCPADSDCQLTRQKKLARDKRSSLFCIHVSDEEKSFITLIPVRPMHPSRKARSRLVLIKCLKYFLRIYYSILMNLLQTS
jgi:hypothetical protein